MRTLEIAGYTLAAGLAIGLGGFAAFSGWLDFDLANNGYRIAFLGMLAVLAAIVARLHRMGSRFATQGKLVLLFLTLCGLIHLVNGQFQYTTIYEALNYSHTYYPVRLEQLFYWFNIDAPGLATAAATGLMALAFRRLLGPIPTTPGSPSQVGIRMRWVFAGLLLLTWPSLSNLFDSVLPIVNQKLDDYQILEFVPFVVTMLLVGSLWREKWVVDGTGIRFLAFGRWAILSARWRRIKQVLVIHQSNGQESFVIHYRGRLLIPFSLIFRPVMSQNGPAMAELIRGAAMEEGLKVAHFRQSRAVMTAGWICLLIGLAFVPAGQVYENMLNQRYIDGLYSAANFADFAGILPLIGLYFIPIIFISLGFGLHSGASIAGSRIILLTAWMVGISFLPSPVIHWLVWTAIYAIETAIMTPHMVLPVLQYPPLLEWAYTVVGLSFAAAPPFFWLGIVAGRRRWRAEGAGVTADTKASVNPPDREAALLVA